MLDLYMREFEQLNEYQKKAVKSGEKYILLNAAVGSGKTTVLTHRILYLHLFCNVQFDDIVVLTFTNRAAGEIRNRVTAFCSDVEQEMKYFGTFHSVAKGILSNSPFIQELGYTNDFQIIDTEESACIIEEIINSSKLNIKYIKKLSKRLDEFKKGKSLYGLMKKEDDINELYALYCEEKLRQNVMDFDDLIQNCIKVLKYLKEPLGPKHIIIDEFQDTDARQLELIRKMADEQTSIFAVGDPDQIIYSWRTGQTNIFSEYRKLFRPVEMELPLNYRSTRTIIEAASQFVGNRQIEGIKDYGNPIVIKKHHDAFNEALHIAREIKALNQAGTAYRDIAVLYRRQAQSEALLDALERENIPCRIVYKKALIYEDNIKQDVNDSVSLMTLHASKGLEFSHVFITGANMGNIPLTSKRSEEEEEARLFFVGMTRAKYYLEISYLAKISLPGAAPYPSSYISMLPNELTVREDEKESKGLDQLMKMLREERQQKDVKKQVKTAEHMKYGKGTIVFEDDDTIKVDFPSYGEKEFSKLFCPLKIC